MAQAANTSAAKAYQYQARTWGGGRTTPLMVCAVVTSRRVRGECGEL